MLVSECVSSKVLIIMRSECARVKISKQEYFPATDNGSRQQEALRSDQAP